MLLAQELVEVGLEPGGGVEFTRLLTSARNRSCPSPFVLLPPLFLTFIDCSGGGRRLLHNWSRHNEGETAASQVQSCHLLKLLVRCSCLSLVLTRCAIFH